MLRKTCEQHPLTEKIIVVDSYFIGEQILLQYVKSGHQAINFKIKTIRDLALDTIQTHCEEMTTTIGSHFMYSIVKSLQQEKKLQYFQELEITPPFSYHMFQLIQELRLAGFTSITIKPSAFVSETKGQDIIRILQRYEKLMVDYQLKDDASLYKQAKEKAVQSERLFLLQSQLSVSYVQEQFLEHLCPVMLSLPVTPVYGVPKPKETKYSFIQEGEPTPLSYIYQLQSEKVKTAITLHKWKTEEEEIKDVLSQIKRKSLRLDDCAIFYTSAHPYVTTVFHLSQSYNIPVTFQDGVPIQFTKPGKLVNGLVQWVRSSYESRLFTKLLQEGLFQMEDEAPSKIRWTTLLRQLNIGWGKARYTERLENEIKKVRERLVGKENEQHQTLEQVYKNLVWMKTWYDPIFTALPSIEKDKHISLRELLQGLHFIIAKMANSTSFYDEAAKTSLLEKIEQLVPYTNEVISVQEALFHIEELLLNMNIGASRAKPGHLHVCSYQKGTYISRNSRFLVGLDQQRFPGSQSENPLLLDKERSNLGKNIPLLQHSITKKNYVMLQLIASSAGHVHVSCCQFDINDNRLLSPSYLFLQCYRYITGDHDADFKQLQKEFPCKEVELVIKKEWWVPKVTASETSEIEWKLLKQFNQLVDGMEAEEFRKSSSFTVYDGKVESDTTHLDPRKNREQQISAGKLELLATCPYSYFLQEVLKVKPIEELKYNEKHWLDPATRGTVLHEIFERFYRMLQERNEKPVYESHHSLLTDLVQDCLQNAKKQLPPPSPQVEWQETKEIIESCETFLKIEEERAHDTEPKYFEYTFGVDGKPPATITLASGPFFLSGKIDRVDIKQDESIHIIDYKTGSTWGYDEQKQFQGGRQLQHFLYSLALENHLGLKHGAVKRSSYLFPTKKGLGQAIERKQETELRTNGHVILEKLLTIIESGHFVMTEDDNDCKFCQFKQICRREQYEADIIEKKHQDYESAGVRSFKGVRAYD